MSRRPDPVAQMAAEAERALRANDVADAIDLAGRVLAKQPRHVGMIGLLGRAKLHTGDLDEALVALKRAAKLAPKDPARHHELALGLMRLADYDGAIAACDAALRLERDHLGAGTLKAEILVRRRRFDEAGRVLDRLRTPEGEDPLAAAAVRAHLLEAAGVADDAEIVATARRVLGLEQAPAGLRRQMLFLLGRRADRRGDVDEAMRRLHEANELLRVRFDRAGTERSLEAIRRTFSAERQPALPQASVPARGVILIVGLPRSGSTLLETMLDAHPRVHGTGEVPHLGTAIRRVRELTGVRYPDGWTRLDAVALDRLASAYHDRLRNSAGAAGRDADVLVDKSLYAAQHLGAIDRLLPGATVVHVHRHRVDAGLSAWMQDLVPTMLPWASDLADCGWNVRAQERHMAHWRRILGDRLLSVRYEDLVDDPERELRRILARAGLPFDEACLRHHERRRDVATASVGQVDEPVHRRALGRAERYREHLGPLLEGLGPEPGSDDAAPTATGDED